MTGRILAGEDRGAGRRADAHGVEVVKPRALSRQSLHGRSSVVVIERVTLGIALLVGQKRHGGIHRAHVVDEKNDDVRFFRRIGRRHGAQERKQDDQARKQTQHGETRQ